MGDAPTQDTRGTGTAAAPLWEEFEAEVQTLERALARAAQIACVLFGVLAFTVGEFVAPRMCHALGALACAATVWFTIVHALYARQAAVRVLLWVTPVFELAIPVSVILVMADTQGAAYTLGSWVPPLVFAIVICMSIMRLKPRFSLALGAVSGATYLAIYFIVLVKQPIVSHLDDVLVRPPMQITRATTLVLFGALASLASRTLRGMIGRAAKTSRAKELFGKYRLGELIASGGMGSVYSAVYCPEGGFERKVAIKRVHPHLAADPSFVVRFREEAELGARLAHPNIVTVLDFGREGETYFFAMEFVDGMDLSRVRKRCAAAKLPIPSRLVAYIGREIAEGLAFAHESAQGADGRPLHVVHRDLNPANILVSRTGQVKISDFGVAKVLREASAHETKNVVGKLAYLAPELAKGTTFDARVDVFALGLVLWELLCLKQAYGRESDAATLSAIVQSRVPPPSLERPELAGTKWDAFFERALQPDFEKRYASAREASLALAEILGDEGMPRPGELVDFLSQVEAIPAPAATSQSVSTLEGSPQDAATVVEPR